MELIQKQIKGFSQFATREEQIEVSIEAIVPDSISDVIRIAFSSANICIKDKTSQTDRLLLSGSVEVQALCITENCATGELISVSIPMSHIVSLHGCTTDTITHVTAQVYECVGQTTNSRKINIKAKVRANCTFYNITDIVLTQGVKECERLHMKSDRYKGRVITAVTEKNVRISETIPITAAGLKVVSYESRFVCEDMRVLKGKMMSRGNCQLKVLFVSPTGEFVREKYHLPYSSIVEQESICETDRITQVFQHKWSTLEVRETSSGIGLVCDISTDIGIVSGQIVEESIVTDAFSCTHETQIKWEDVECTSCEETECIKKEISREWVNISNAVKIIDYCVNTNVGFSDHGMIYGAINLCVMYRDVNGEIYSTYCRAEVEYDTEKPLINIAMSLDGISLLCTEDGGIKMECICVFDIQAGENSRISQVAACRIVEENAKDRRTNATLILRNIGEGDTIWEIAKRYSTSPTAILDANKLTNQEFLPGSLIMIPIVK